MDEEEKKDSKKVFVLRVILWSLFACIIPIVFIGWRYGLFTKISGLQLSGFGLVGVIIGFVFVYVVIKYVRAGFIEWSMTKQIISGIIKIVLPLGGLIAVCASAMNSLDVFIQAASLVLVSEVIAIPINPFPKWVYEKSKGRFESAVDFICDRIYNKNKENKEGE